MVSTKSPRKQFRVKAERYTFKQFEAQYPDDASCLADIFRKRFPNGITCPKCGKHDKFTPIVTRRAYSCMCGFQVYPTAGSIFHKSTTSLKTWYYAMYLMGHSRNGVAALELQRLIGTTYKTAWRMMHQIRALMADELPPFKGTVEVDETYVGGKSKNMHKAQREGRIKGRGPVGKTIVVAALEREGGVAPFVVEKADAETAENLLAVTTDKDAAKVHTDEYGAYHGLKDKGYQHDTVNHGNAEWVRGDVHTNGIEGFWSQMKRSIDGTHHHVSKKHLQAYADEYAFRFNRRRSEKPMFAHLVSQMNEQRG